MSQNASGISKNEQNNQRPDVNRDPRFTSHALVEVRKFKHLPFFAESAVLLDLSIAGFKLEFTGEVESKVGAQYWLSIPLRPLGIMSPARLFCRAECRWYDEARFRIGGVFLNLPKEDRLILEQVLEALREKGFGA